MLCNWKSDVSLPVIKRYFKNKAVQKPRCAKTSLCKNFVVQKLRCAKTELCKNRVMQKQSFCNATHAQRFCIGVSLRLTPNHLQKLRFCTTYLVPMLCKNSVFTIALICQYAKITYSVSVYQNKILLDKVFKKKVCSYYIF